MSGYKHWIPGPDWTGKTAVVVATGPSLSLEQVRIVALARMKDRCRVLAINDAALVCWFCDIAFAGDMKWWEERKSLAGFRGKKVGIDVSIPPASPTVPASPDIAMVRRAGAFGYDVSPGRIFTHKNSGAMGCQVAADLNPDKIILLGFDMREMVIDGKLSRHFFGNYEGKLNTSPDISTWIKNFQFIANALSGKLFNATKGSALEGIVPYVDLEAALNV